MRYLGMVAGLMGCLAGVAAQAEPAGAPMAGRVTLLPMPGDFRLHTIALSPGTQVDDPGSRLRTGFGNAMVDLFPFGDGLFHLSAGTRLYGRARRPHLSDPDRDRLLSGPRWMGPRFQRKSIPVAMMGIGHTVEHGLAFGLDTGVVFGELLSAPYRFGQSQRARMGMARGSGINQLTRATMLFRF